MATKAEETAQGATGCLAKAADDEPIFVLRAQDALAPMIVKAWAEAALKVGVPVEKIQEAVQLADQMTDWQATNHTKLPD